MKETENIFEGAKFGDKFLTKDGRRAIYFCCALNAYEKGEKAHILAIEGNAAFFQYYDDGKIAEHVLSELARTQEYMNIVSKYTEPIDEEKLDKLAVKFANELPPNIERGGKEWTTAYCSYKVGYRKAKEK